MKAVILAGGKGTRLRPLTNLMNKHLLPVGERPMISHAIEKLRDAGITEILIITGRSSAGLFASYLGSGSDDGVSLTYRIQEEAGGIAQALSLAEPFIGNDRKFMVLLGDNLYEEALLTHLEAFRQQSSGALVLLKQVEDPTRYGVPIFDPESGAIVRIEEKPAEPASDYCVTGIYMYDADVFNRIKTIQPSRRGELEITDVNNAYAASGELHYRVLSGWWTDAGTFDSLHEAACLVREGRER